MGFSDQESVFLGSEANAWYARNREAISSPRHEERDAVARLLQRHGAAPKRVLETGCSNGWRLSALRRRYDCVAVGIEPSEEAIREGEKRDPLVEFRKGTIDSLPLRDGEQFDLVIVNFVFHWVSRPKLMKAFAETDRAVNPGGLLALGDFSPDVAHRVRYHHLADQDVFTWKAEYWKPFVATELYRLIALETSHHGEGVSLGVSPGDRVFHCLLEKRRTDDFPVIQR